MYLGRESPFASSSIDPELSITIAIDAPSPSSTSGLYLSVAGSGGSAAIESSSLRDGEGDPPHASAETNTAAVAHTRAPGHDKESNGRIMSAPPSEQDPT